MPRLLLKIVVTSLITVRIHLRKRRISNKIGVEAELINTIDAKCHPKLFHNETRIRSVSGVGDCELHLTELNALLS